MRRSLLSEIQKYSLNFTQLSLFNVTRRAAEISYCVETATLWLRSRFGKDTDEFIYNWQSLLRFLDESGLYYIKILISTTINGDSMRNEYWFRSAKFELHNSGYFRRRGSNVNYVHERIELIRQIKSLIVASSHVKCREISIMITTIAKSTNIGVEWGESDFIHMLLTHVEVSAYYWR